MLYGNGRQYKTAVLSESFWRFLSRLTHCFLGEGKRPKPQFYTMYPQSTTMTSRIKRALSRARYAAIGAAIGAAVGGLVSNNAASTGGAVGALVGATIGEKRVSVGSYLDEVKKEGKEKRSVLSRSD
jgi:hypothetical protein